MDYRFQSKLSKQEVLRRAAAFSEYDAWYSWPKPIEGSVSGSKIKLKARNSLIRLVGAGSFEGYVQEIDGRTYIIGRLSKPYLAAAQGILLGGILFVTLLANDDLSVGSAFVCLVFAISGFWVVKSDHKELKRVIEEIGSRAG